MARHGLVLLFLIVGCLSATSIAKKSACSTTTIAIDLGSTYTRVSTWSFEKGFQIIPNDQGNLMTPSWISFNHNETFIGEAAKNRAVVYPESTTSFDAKKFIGRNFEDEELQSYMKLVPYKIVNNNGYPYFHIKIMDAEHKLFNAHEITTMIISKMKERAEAFLGKEIQGAVITVPAYFNDAQKRATWGAATMAGMDVRIYTEPQAAAMAYNLNEIYGEKNILVFDLGGGTFDTTIIYVKHGSFKTLATNGDAQLGGEDFDQRIMEYFTMMIKKKHGKDTSKDKKALFKLKSECERAKIALSKEHQVQVEIKSLFDGVDFSEPLTRAQFEELNMDLFNKTIELVKKALENAGLKKQQIDEIILVGGSTRIPKVKQLLKDYFDGKEANTGVNPDEAVALGACRRAIMFTEDKRCNLIELSLSPLHSNTLGVQNDSVLMTTSFCGLCGIPSKKSKVFTTNQDNQTTLSIQVYVGDWDTLKQCTLLKQFKLTGIPPAPRGTPRIEVTFEFSYGNITVKAEDKGTGKSEKLPITRDFEIELMESYVKDDDRVDLRIVQEDTCLPSDVSIILSLKKFCAVTRYKDACFETIHALNIPPKDNHIHFFNLSLLVTLNEVTRLTPIPRIIAQQEADNSSGSSWMGCGRAFDRVVVQIEEAMAHMNVNDTSFGLTKVKAIESMIKRARRDQDACIDQLAMARWARWVDSARQYQETSIDELEEREIRLSPYAKLDLEMDKSKMYLSNNIFLLKNFKQHLGNI